MADRIKYAFGVAGDLTPVPETSAGTELSEESGWSSAYSLKKTEAGYRFIDRGQHNTLWNKVTGNVKQWQEQTYPQWFDDIAYTKNKIFTYVVDGNDYICIDDAVAGTLPTDTDYFSLLSDFLNLGTAAYANTGAGSTNIPTNDDVDNKLSTKLDKAGLVLLTGSATFTNVDNNINMTGIGNLFEIGDVIGLAGSPANSKYFTVEMNTDSDNIVVNYEHRGGTTSKSLVDEASTVTVSLISKWNVAAAGLGQGWVNLTASRSKAATYTNNTNRDMNVSISFYGPSSNQHIFHIDGLIIQTINSSTDSKSISEVVGAYSEYVLTSNETSTISSWNERR